MTHEVHTALRPSLPGARDSTHARAHQRLCFIISQIYGVGSGKKAR